MKTIWAILQTAKKNVCELICVKMESTMSVLHGIFWNHMCSVGLEARMSVRSMFEYGILH